MLLPVLASNFLPPSSPFLRQKVQNFWIFLNLEFLPISRMRCAKKKIKGTGIRLPKSAIIRTSHSGRPRPMPIGTAPRSSISGTMETSKTRINLKIITINYTILFVGILGIVRGATIL